MKYLYCNSKLIDEIKPISCIDPIAQFIETPILQFSNRGKFKIGLLDIPENKEYEIPLQIGSLTIREMQLFNERVEFIVNSGYYDFVSVKFQLRQFKQLNSGSSFKWLLHNLSYEYIRRENLRYFFEIILPFINWGLHNSKDINLILLFTTLFCKRDILTKESDFSHKYPYLRGYFLNDVQIKQHFNFVSRVGRDDHAYEYTKICLTPEKNEEIYFTNYIGKYMSDSDYGNDVTINKNGEKYEFVFCTMYDDNAYGDYTHDYSEEQCNSYKQMLKNKSDEIYWAAFEEFIKTFTEFRSQNPSIFK